jgi:hypothetical protein
MTDSEHIGLSLATGQGKSAAARAMLARPADSPPPGEEWKKVPGYSVYEWSHRGQVRSPARPDGLRQRPNNSGYLVVNVVNDAGVKETVLVHRMILRAHAGEFGPGEESLHGAGGQLDNRYPENLRKDTHVVNVAERVAANPPAPKPPKVCPRCGAEHRGRGRNCPGCVQGLADAAARMLAAGMPLDKVSDELRYPPVACFNLAVRRGGLRVTLSDPEPGHVPSPMTWSRSVLIRAKAWRRNSDAQ